MDDPSKNLAAPKVIPTEEPNQNALDRMVQLVGQTKLDARAGNHWDDLADSLPCHSD